MTCIYLSYTCPITLVSERWSRRRRWPSPSRLGFRVHLDPCQPDIGCQGPDIEARDPISGTRYRVTLDIGVHNFDIEDRDPISGQHIGSRYRSSPISKITHFDIGVRYRSIPISKYLNFDIGSCNFDIGFFGVTYRTRYRRSISTFDIEDHQLRYRRSISYAISGAISDDISDTISYTI